MPKPLVDQRYQCPVPLVAVADHLLEAVARNVDHRTAVTQEGQPLVDHRLPDVTPAAAGPAEAVPSPVDISVT